MRLVGLFLLALSLSAQTIGTRIDNILRKSPAAQQALWGIRVVDLRTGATVYSKNQSQFFIPASNAKLFSTALALTRLGPDHRFRTVITTPAMPDANGRVSGLRFVGGGDPNLSGRPLPYQYNVPRGNPLQYVEQFARQLYAGGLRQVDGDITGDDSAYAYEPYPEGWALDDPVYDYGAPVSALLLNDGMFTVRVTPTDDGEPPRIDSIPLIPGLTIHNRAITSHANKLKFDRLPGASELVVSGTVSTVQEQFLGMDDPTLFAAQALRDALLRQGIQVSGEARVEHFPAPGVSLLTHESQPLIEDLRIINKESVNLHAEIVLLEVARVRHGTGSREAALADLETFLGEAGVPAKQYFFRDGSGLSRQTLVTPLAITQLLEYMYKSPHRDAWISTLPVGGSDGTLGRRFAGLGGARRVAASKVQAKTGSIAHVNALSGYAGRYAFTILVNNSNQPASGVRRVMDQIALTLVP